jgi:hypothetical protein
MTREERFQEKAEAVLAGMNNFDKGEPVAAVDPDRFERMWKAIKELHESVGPTKAIGFGLIAGHAGLDYESMATDEIVGLTVRSWFMSALLKRPMLSPYLENGEPSDEVFRAVASMPLSKDDIGEAMLLGHLRDQNPHVIEEFKKEAHENGYDPDHPLIDGKFLEWMKHIANQTKDAQ